MVMFVKTIKDIVGLLQVHKGAHNKSFNIQHLRLEFGRNGGNPSSPSATLHPSSIHSGRYMHFLSLEMDFKSQHNHREFFLLF